MADDLDGGPAGEPPCLRPFLRWILARHAALGGVTEVRVLRKSPRRGTWSGLFGPEHIDALVAAVLPAHGGPRANSPRGEHPRSGEAGFYFTLQPVGTEAPAESRGRLTRARAATKDQDILAYTLFVVDVDPERNPRDVSASDLEKEQALEVVRAVRAWFVERGVHPIEADSGNGYHLLIPLTPAEPAQVPERARDARDLLRLLHARFSSAGAKVDTSTFNPSRIFKLYGTRAVKGAPTPERPHRLATVDLDDIPDDVDLFSLVAAELAEHRATETRRPTAPARGERSLEARPENQGNGTWRLWRDQALAALPLEAVYGPWLTGKASGAGWRQCRDPGSESGDRHPSAGVADGSGDAERGSFHSFITGRTVSVFDFLCDRGMASGFRDACARVADLSGVPLPSRLSPPTNAGSVLTRLRARWEQLEGGARQRLLREALRDLLDVPAVERDAALRTVRETTGLSMRLLRETLTELRREARERRATQPRPAPAPERGRRVVDYVVNGDTVAAFFDRLVEAVGPARRLFRDEKELQFVRRGVGPVVVTDRNLPGLLAALVEIRFLRDTDDGPSFVRYGVLPSELARAFVNDPRVWTKLPELRLYCRSPLFVTGWHFIGAPGYHAGAGVFYDGPRVEPAEGEPALLRRVLADFHWKAEVDLVNFVGCLLTAITIPMWGRGHPFLAINGNKPGVGKTTLARILGVLVEGHDPSTVSYVPDDGEFEKQLATRVEAGDRVIVVDNAKTRRSIESPVLERCITDSRLNFRRLGSNTSISRPQNDVLFCLTMNLTALGQDLRRRALPVNLVLEENVREARYGMDDVVGFTLERRLDLVAELAGMVRAWCARGRPPCDRPAKHSTSQLWAATIDSILRVGGFEGFLSNFEESAHAFDPSWELMADVAAAHHDKPAAYAADWVQRLEESGLDDRYRTRSGKEKSARAKATITGSLFSEYVGNAFPVGAASYRLVRTWPEGERRKPSYHFEEVVEP